MGLQHSYLSSLYMLWFICYFLAVWVVIFVILCSIVLLFVCWVWWIVFNADFIWYCFVGHNVPIFVLCFDICWCLYSFGKWVWCFFWFLLRLCVWKFTCVCGFGLPILYHCVFGAITCVCFCLECITLIHSFFCLIYPTAFFFGCMWFSLCISDSW